MLIVVARKKKEKSWEWERLGFCVGVDGGEWERKARAKIKEAQPPGKQKSNKFQLKINDKLFLALPTVAPYWDDRCAKCKIENSRRGWGLVVLCYKWMF